MLLLSAGAMKPQWSKEEVSFFSLSFLTLWNKWLWRQDTQTGGEREQSLIVLFVTN
jgi:hypothetical protein